MKVKWCVEQQVTSWGLKDKENFLLLVTYYVFQWYKPLIAHPTIQQMAQPCNKGMLLRPLSTQNIHKGDHKINMMWIIYSSIFCLTIESDELAERSYLQASRSSVDCPRLQDFCHYTCFLNPYICSWEVLLQNRIKHTITSLGDISVTYWSSNLYHFLS